MLLSATRASCTAVVVSSMLSAARLRACDGSKVMAEGGIGVDIWIDVRLQCVGCGLPFDERVRIRVRNIAFEARVRTPRR